MKLEYSYSLRPLKLEYSYSLHGFSFLEVLIALFIISFGLLGLAELQVFALRNNYFALLQSCAATQVYSGSARFSHGDITKEKRLWNKINAEVLPHGRGEYQAESKKISICWQQQCLTI